MININKKYNSISTKIYTSYDKFDLEILNLDEILNLMNKSLKVKKELWLDIVVNGQTLGMFELMPYSGLVEEFHIGDVEDDGVSKDFEQVFSLIQDGLTSFSNNSLIFEKEVKIINPSSQIAA